MKRKLCVALTALVVLAFGSTAEVFTQEPQPPIAGGYQEASTNGHEVVSAARFAVGRERRRRGGRVSLISVKRAETQVVAGINYRLCLRVRRNGRTQEVVTVVYQDLQQRYSRSSWRVESCKRSD
jgi:hypothetical protein